MKALQKPYRRLLSGYGKILYCFLNIGPQSWRKNEKSTIFANFEVQYFRIYRILPYPLKSLLYGFQRAFRWYDCFSVKNKFKIKFFCKPRSDPCGTLRYRALVCKMYKNEKKNCTHLKMILIPQGFQKCITIALGQKIEHDYNFHGTNCDQSLAVDTFIF